LLVRRVKVGPVSEGERGSCPTYYKQEVGYIHVRFVDECKQSY
jgi:hypothetical protein